MCLLYQWIGFQIEDSPMPFCEYMISYILLNDKYVWICRLYTAVFKTRKGGGGNQLETFECMFKTENINRLPRFMSVRTIHVHYFVFIICTDSW